jgi:hypothetical protein
LQKHLDALRAGRFQISKMDTKTGHRGEDYTPTQIQTLQRQVEELSELIERRQS